LVSGAALGQAPERLSFEVASIKPAPPLSQIAEQIESGKLHLGTSIEGARVDIGFASLAELIIQAYKIKPHQLTAPDWIKQERFDILAKLPDGSSRDQVPEMLQSLLVDRFKLAIHRDSKEQSVYALVVGKNGLKMKESPPEPDTPAADANGPTPPPAATPDGQVSIRQEGGGAMISGGPNGNVRMTMGENGSMRMEMSKVSMRRLADVLTPFMDRPVIDMTELKGNYQVTLELPMQELMNMARAMAPGLAGAGAPGFGPGAGAGPATDASDPSGTSMFQAVQRLGLKLESRKAPVESIVVDRVEKTPTEN
jgi:uncharacterized protein (TIGR03435 family)